MRESKAKHEIAIRSEKNSLIKRRTGKYSFIVNA